MEITTRADAHQWGFPKFFTGIPCRKGHISERYTTNGACTQCAQQFHKMAPGPSSELMPLQPAVVYTTSAMTPALVDELNTYLAQCVMHWTDSKGFMTDTMRYGYETLAKDAADKRRVRDHQMAHPGRPTIKTVSASNPKRAQAEAFFAALSTKAGKDLDGMTELIRQQGEPDAAFRLRIRAKTLQNLGQAQ